MTTKLKIDLKQGMLEVEGSEVFVKAIYKDFKIHFLGEEAGDTLEPPTRRRRRAKPQAKSKPKTAPKTAPTAKRDIVEEPVESKPDVEREDQFVEPDQKTRPAATPAKPSPYTVVKDLDLKASDDRPSLVDFMDNKFPITNEERNLVFLYYLQYLLKTKPITADHIFSCYKAAKIRVPLDLESSLQTTAKQRRWIKMTKTGRLSVTPSGKLYVENQLPKKLKS